MPDPRRQDQNDQTLQTDSHESSPLDTADVTAAHETLKPLGPIVPRSQPDAQATIMVGITDTPKVTGVPRVQNDPQATFIESGPAKPKVITVPGPQTSADATFMDGGMVKPRISAGPNQLTSADATFMDGGMVKPRSPVSPSQQSYPDSTLIETGNVQANGPVPQANAEATVIAEKNLPPKSSDAASQNDATLDSNSIPGTPRDNNDKTAVINSSSASPPSPLASGSLVGRFALKALHARGGLGEVFTARDTELNREVALKRIQIRFADDQAARRRFLSEAEITARLDHPGVVPVFGLVNDRFGRPCYAMRFIRGETLKDEIERYYGTKSEKDPKNKSEKDPKEKEAKASQPTDEVRGQPRSVAFRHLLQRFISVCQAIAYAHTRKVIHRDIKPANVMVGSFGETLVVDWGLAKSLDDTPATTHIMKAAAEAGFRHDPEATEQPDHVTLAGTAIGTPAFMPPEQANGRLDLVGPASDVYSLGATLFAILTGRTPYSGGASETLERVRRGEIPSATSMSPNVSPPLDAVCHKAMAFRIEDRYPTPLELAADIERWLSDEPVSCYPDPLGARLARWARRHPARVAAGVSLLLAGVFAIGGIALAVGREQAKTAAALDMVTKAEKETAKERDQVKLEQGRTQTALNQVTQEKAETEKQRAAAVEARNTARDRYVAAVKAFNVLVVNIQDTLADRAGTQDLRRELLVEAKAGLEKLIKEGSTKDKAGPDGNPQRRMGDSTLIAALRQMGDVYQLLGKTREAREEYRRAVEMAIEVLIDAQARKNAVDEKAARHDLGASSIRFADIQLQAGNTAASKSSCETALEMYQKILEQDPSDRDALEGLAAAQEQLSEVLIERGETAAAAERCRNTLEIRRKLHAEAKATSDSKRQLLTLRRVGDSLEQCSDILLRSGRSSEAAQVARELLDARVEVDKIQHKNPEVQRDLAAAYSRLGEILLERDDLAAAGKQFEAARTILDALLAEDPRSAGTKAALAITRGWLAEVAFRRGDLEAAHREAMISRNMCKEVDTDDPDSTRTTRDLAVSYERLGDILLAQGKADEAVENYLESEKALFPIERNDPVSALAKRALAHARERLGAGQLAIGDAADAVISLHSSVDLRRAATRGDSGSARAKRELAFGLGLLADAYRATNQPQHARNAVADEVSLLREVIAVDKDNLPARRQLALASGKWAELLAAEGKPTVALIIASQSVDQFRALSSDKDNAHAQADLAMALSWLAAVYSQIGQPDPAKAAAHEILAIRTELANKAGKTKSALRDEANAKILVGDTFAAKCEFSRARDFYKSARELLVPDPNDALTTAAARTADEKLELLKAVEGVAKDPAHGLADIAPKLHIPALRAATDWLIKANRASLGATVALQLQSKATTPEDFYIAAQTLARCSTSTASNITQEARDSYKLDAVKALESAAEVGFREAELLSDPKWDACRPLPGFQAVEKLIATSKPLAPRPRAIERKQN